MKSRKTFFLVLLLFIMSILSSCTSSNSGELGKTVEFGSNASNILINTNNTDSLSFNVALFSNKKISKVDYIGLEGANINSDNFTVNIIDNNIDALNKYKYKGLFVKYIMVEVMPNGSVENCEFSNIVLHVDGVRRDISFNTPVKHEFLMGNVFTEELRISVIPNDFSSNFINDNEQIATYEFEATKDLTINKVSFSDFLKPTNIKISIDDSESQDASFPIEVSSGQNVKIGFSFESNEATQESYVATNLMFEYTTKEDNENHFNNVVVVFDPIYPLNDGDNSNVDKLINSIKF